MTVSLSPANVPAWALRMLVVMALCVVSGCGRFGVYLLHVDGTETYTGDAGMDAGRPGAPIRDADADMSVDANGPDAQQPDAQTAVDAADGGADTGPRCKPASSMSERDSTCDAVDDDCDGKLDEDY
jgi:hypothetical protein